MQASRVSEDPIAVLRIIQVTREGAEASLNAICWLDKEVRELSEFHPNEDRIGLMESVVQMFEEEILEWERIRTVRPDSAAVRGSFCVCANILLTQDFCQRKIFVDARFFSTRAGFLSTREFC
jgi:hypothetical protein